MRNWLIGLALLLVVLGASIGYMRWDAVQEERAEVARKAAEDYQALNDKYNAISTKYTALKAAKETKRQEQVVKEDRIIHENREYYAGDCFDDIGLQHIQQAQGSSAAQ